MDTNQLTEIPGVTHILSYDNIAIVVLMVMCIFLSSLIVYLLKGFLAMKEVLDELRTLIEVLNNRLNNH